VTNKIEEIINFAIKSSINFNFDRLSYKCAYNFSN